MADSKLPLNICYKNLKLSKDAGMEEVKQAYRKLALRMHPDLNPNNPKAHQNFQVINESYATIISHLSEEGKRKEQTINAKKEKNEALKKKAQEAERIRKERIAQKEKEREERLERERKLDNIKREKEKERREQLERERIRERMARAEAARKEKSAADEAEMQKSDALHKQRIIDYMQSEMDKNSKQNVKQFTTAYSKNGTPIVENVFENDINFHETNAKEQQDFNKIFQKNKSKEQILQELLEDESAQKVYKDIYEELSKKINSNDPTINIDNSNLKTNTSEKNTSEKNPNTEKQESVLHHVLEHTEQITSGIKQGVSSWLKSQIDEEMELFFPAAKLVAGARIRLQIKEGWSRQLQTLEVTLPPDFKPGKPMRLKGMGKKIGKWKGDLYLKLQIR